MRSKLYTKINYGNIQSRFNIENMLKHLGATKYIGEFDLLNNPVPQTQSLFYSKNPDKSKGHKQFPYTFIPHSFGENSKLFVIGAFDRKTFNKDFRYWTGIYCPDCGEVIVSVHRWHYNTCSCYTDEGQGQFIDGGNSNYIRCRPGSEIVMVDIFKGEVLFGSRSNQDKKKTKANFKSQSFRTEKVYDK